MPPRKKAEETSVETPLTQQVTERYSVLDKRYVMPAERVWPAEPDATAQALYDAGLAAGYAKGLEDARPRPPLFDACKKVTEQYVGDERGWFSAISAVEDEYGETLAVSDRDLLRGVHSRYRLVRESQRLSELTQSPVKPKTQLPAPDAPRGATEYEVVA